jgi:carboxymethylenebutenolidase
VPTVNFAANGSQSTGYLAVPEQGTGAAVIVLQEWWGLDGHIRDVCDRLSREGFFALAPDLYDGEVTDRADEAEQKMLALSIERAERDMRGAVDFLIAQDGVRGEGVGSLGFCMGGGLAVWAAARNPKVNAAVTYYGRPQGQLDLTQTRGPVLGHYGTIDEFIPEQDARELEDAMRRAGVEVRFEYYTAGHAFFNDTDRLGTYDPDAAGQSWRRTLEFLRSALTCERST